MNQSGNAEKKNKKTDAYLTWKHRLDIVFAFLALCALAPFMLLLVLLIRLDSRGPAIFTQMRVGQNEKLFPCYKFRTMLKDSPHHLASADFSEAQNYITRVGKLLRKTSLDELPQLINILRGEMSFIGPRPLIPEETQVHELRRKYGVYALRPGISGYAQVNGRDFVSDEEKARLDDYYLNHLSLRLDVKVLVDTVVNVIRKKDIQN
ncbi:MAG: sugar transferase [Clostridia bacterium]|nr:sugar transferase [Clostridia bacterium]